MVTAGWIAIAAFGLVLLWLALFFHRVGDYLTESDFYGGYAPGAELIRHGRLDASRYQVVGPLYELALAIGGLVVRDLFTTGKLLSVAAACGALISWWLLLARRAGAAVGFWAIVLLAVNPQFTRYGFSATTDMLAIGLQAACLFALLGARARFAPLVSGALAGLAALTRYNAAVLLPAGLLCIAWPGAVAGASRKRTAALFLAGFAAVAAPWLIYSLSQGQVPGAMLVRNFVYYATPDAARNTQDLPGDLDAPATPTTSLGDLLQRDAGALVMRALGAIPNHLAQDAGVLLGWPVATLCLLGLALLISERRFRLFGPLWIPGVALFIVLVPVFYSPRYSLPLAPFYLTLAAAAIASPQFALAVGRAGVPLKWLIALLPVALTLQSNVALQRQLESQTPVEVIEAGRALRDAAPPGARVVSRKGHIGYYSGLEVAPFPRFAKLSDLAESSRRNHAEFLYFSWLEVQLRPDFSYLLDTTSAVPGLSVVHSTDRQASVVYRIGPDFGRDPVWLTDPLLSRLHWERVLVRALPAPLAAPHRNLLAAFALDRRRPEEALEQADHATRAQPSDTLGWTLKGQALRELGRPEEAQRAFETALSLDPNEVQSRIGLGWVQLTLGHLEEAARAWRPVIAATRDDSTLRAMQGLFEKLGDQEAARAAAGVRR
jgi:tetratricopeptide (TPR) repeat protein